MNDIEYIDSQKKCVDNEEFFKISYDHQLEKRKLAVIKSLKWVVLNLGETQNNTFENAIKLYTQAAIEVMECANMIKSDKNIDMNKLMIHKGLKVREISTGIIATIKFINFDDDMIFLSYRDQIGVVPLSNFWNYFEEVSK